MGLTEILQAAQTFGLIPVLFAALIYYILRQHSEESRRFHETLSIQQEKLSQVNDKFYTNMLGVMKDVNISIRELLQEISNRKNVTDRVLQEIVTLRKDFNGFAKNIRETTQEMESGIYKAVSTGLQIQTPKIQTRSEDYEEGN